MAEGSAHGFLYQSRKQFKPSEEGGCPWWNERRTYSRWEAWMDLIQSAAYRDHERLIDGEVVRLSRGETPPMSLRFLALRWSWSLKRVRSFLEAGIGMDRVRAHQGTRNGHTYLIVNYEAYQDAGHGKGTARAQLGHSKGTKEKEVKTVKKRTTPLVVPPQGTDETRLSVAYPPALVEAIPDIDQLWPKRLAAAGKKLKPTAAQAQLERLAGYLPEHGAERVRELILDATAAGWQGIKIEWSQNNSRPDRAGRPSGRGTVAARRQTEGEPSAELLGGHR